MGFIKPFKYDYDLRNYSKKLNLNLIPTNNPDSILTNEYLENYEIDAIKKNAKEYIPDAVSDQDIIVLETTRGIMKLDLFNHLAPNHCYNFKKLANSGF